jgi:AcrR family transcriptional regulator
MWSVPAEPKTERGRRTRERIVTTAAALIERQGVEATGLDQVLAGAQASKSQLYHYFHDKEELVRAVIAWQAARIVEAVAERLATIDSWESLDAWFEELVAYQQSQDCHVGCPIGTLAAEMADTSEAARHDLAVAFGQWEAVIRKALDALRLGGHLDAGADTAQLATATLATIQGGLLLAKTSRDPGRLRASLAAARADLYTYAPAHGPRA